MGITKDVFDILAQNQKVRDAFNKGVDALVDAVTGDKPTLESRKAALLAVVGSLDGIAAQVSDFRAYHAALIGLCFEAADVAGRAVLVDDLYARPNRFFFPVPVTGSKLILGRRQSPREDVFGVVDPSGTFQAFYAIGDPSGQAIDIDALRKELDESDSDESFLSSLRASGRRVNALIGVTEVPSPPGHRYSPLRPEPFGDDMAVPIVRRAGTTRKLLEAALTQHLNSGTI